MRTLLAWLRARFTAPAVPLVPATQNSSGGQSPVIKDIQGNVALNYYVPEASVFHRDDRRIPRQLPDRPVGGHLFGRDVELRKLTELLQRGDHGAVVGPAGLGKTALAAEAVRAVIGKDDTSLLGSPFPDGVVLLDLYRLKGRADEAWSALATALIGGDVANLPARQRAVHACINRRVLVIIEGAEEADGLDTRCRLADLLQVLDPANRHLILTRDVAQVDPRYAVKLTDALDAKAAGDLFDQITEAQIPPAVRESVLTLLQGHPLALTWAASLLARGDDSAQQLLSDWTRSSLPDLCDPVEAGHTLKWLFERSVRGLNATERTVLDAAGLLAHTEFPLEAMTAALGNKDEARAALKRLVQSGLLRMSANQDGHWHFTHVLGYQFARRESDTEPELRERLANWLQTELTALMSSGVSAKLPRLLLQISQLLRADHDQSLWSLGNYCLYDGLDRITVLGRLDLVEQLLNSIDSWIERLPPDSRADFHWQREHEILLNRLGDLQQAQGDLAAALQSYSDAHDIALKLAQSDPTIAEWQRDLSVSHNKVGQVQEAQGNPEAALRNYLDGHDITTTLVQTDPTNTHWQRDLSVSYNRLGDLQRAQGDLTAALRSYTDSRDNRLKFASSDPTNTLWQRDLCVSITKLGSLQVKQSNWTAALGSYSDSRDILLKLTRSDPTNTEWQRDLSFSLTQLSKVMEQCQLWIDALISAEQSLAIDECLAALDPSNATWQNDVLVSRRIVARLRERAKRS